MAIYRKTVRTGKFAKAGEHFKENDLLTILDEGVKVEGTFGMQDVFKVKVPDGEELSLAFNKTSINNMIDAYGPDSLGWINQPVKAWRILQSISGKMQRVTYLSHPDADIDEDGNFFIPGRQDGPTEEPAPMRDYEEIRAEDIGF